MKCLAPAFFLAVQIFSLNSQATPPTVSRANPASREFIVWNVGQGEWVTLVRLEACDHFDMGGERAPWKQIAIACAKRANRVFFSHWDWDHISFAQAAKAKLKNLCVSQRPLGESSKTKMEILNSLPDCLDQSDRPQELWHRGLTQNSKTKSNDRSNVFVAEHRQILIPGDAGKREEADFKAAALFKIQYLVLGHHGSRTATSARLLKQMPRLVQAIATARRAKYGHPHKEVIARVRATNAALILTEDWGSLRFELKPRGKLACTRGNDQRCARPESGASVPSSM